MLEYVDFEKLVTAKGLLENIKIFKIIKNRFKHFINSGFLDYYIKILNKYEKTKTLLHRQPTYFYDIYFPSKLVLNNKIILTDSVKELFSEESYITIIGEAGSGKSTLVQHLFMNSIVESYKAPILILLRDIDIKHNDMETYIKKIIFSNNLGTCDEILEELLESGNFIFFLDGYDEIKSDNKYEITKYLEEFVHKYYNNNFLITSRPSSDIEYLYKFNNYYIKDLERKDISKFVKKQISDTDHANNIISSIEDSNNEYIFDFIKNNLLLTLYILTFNKNNLLPNKKSIFYHRVFEVLFVEHDSATKNSYERERKSKLTQENFEEILEIFSFISLFKSKFNMDRKFIHSVLNTIKKEVTKYEFSNNDFIYDMILSVGLWTEDNGIISFAHKSLQEYFTASYIKNISDNKKEIYKIINNINTTQTEENTLDIKNLLTLCSEMDRIHFIEYFLIDNLKVMKQIIKKYNSINTVYLLFDSIHASDRGVTILPNKELSIELKTKVFYNDNNLSIEDSFHDIFNKIQANLTLHNCHKYFTSKGLSARGHMFIVSENSNKEYIKFINNMNVVNLLDNLYKNITIQIGKYEEEVSISKENEISFISMIK